MSAASKKDLNDKKYSYVSAYNDLNKSTKFTLKLSKYGIIPH
jgi:hypothetical protein